MIIGYVRVSTEQQVEGPSLDRQVERIHLYCKLHDLGEPLIITDKGKSGYKTKRAGYQRILQLCDSGDVTHVIATDLSRLSRRVRDILSLVEDVLIPSKVQLVCIDQAIDTSTPTGKAMLTMLATFAQLYRDETAHKIKTALAHKKSKGEAGGGHVPYGYTLEAGTLVEDPTEQRAIAFMLERRAAGLGARAIATELRREGYLTKRGWTLWDHKSVLRVLQRE